MYWKVSVCCLVLLNLFQFLLGRRMQTHTLTRSLSLFPGNLLTLTADHDTFSFLIKLTPISFYLVLQTGVCVECILFFHNVALLSFLVHACLCVCVYVCVHACVRACVSACVHACMCTCVHACVPTCTCVLLSIVPLVSSVYTHTHTIKTQLHITPIHTTMFSPSPPLPPDKRNTTTTNLTLICITSGDSGVVEEGASGKSSKWELLLISPELQGDSCSDKEQLLVADRTRSRERRLASCSSPVTCFIYHFTHCQKHHTWTAQRHHMWKQNSSNNVLYTFFFDWLIDVLL